MTVTGFLNRQKPLEASTVNQTPLDRICEWTHNPGSQWIPNTHKQLPSHTAIPKSPVCCLKFSSTYPRFNFYILSNNQFQYSSTVSPWHIFCDVPSFKLISNNKVPLAYWRTLVVHRTYSFFLLSRLQCAFFQTTHSSIKEHCRLKLIWKFVMFTRFTDREMNNCTKHKLTVAAKESDTVPDSMAQLGLSEFHRIPVEVTFSCASTECSYLKL